MKSISVDDARKNQRLDVVVFSFFPKFSRSSIKKLITSGKITINKLPVKPAHKLKLNDRIYLPIELTEELKAPSIDLRVIYEDNDVFVIYKPESLLSHSKGVFNAEPTVATWLKSKLPDLEGDRAGIVHRLDRATSGIMILAKNPVAQKWLQKQFSTRRVKKVYRAIINGEINPAEAVIDMPIQRNPKSPATFKVGINGKPSLTRYKTIEIGPTYSLIELSPETGRTHQLRVHLAKLKKPIVGDTLYGGESAERLYLHALTLELTLPSKERKVFSSDIPEAFTSLTRKASK